MIVKDIEYKLKDGRNALIRSPQDEDIQGMLEYLYISAGETDFILRYSSLNSAPFGYSLAKKPLSCLSDRRGAFICRAGS